MFIWEALDHFTQCEKPQSRVNGFVTGQPDRLSGLVDTPGGAWEDRYNVGYRDALKLVKPHLRDWENKNESQLRSAFYGLSKTIESVENAS